MLLVFCVLTFNFSPVLAGTFNVSPVKINLSKNSSTAIITVSNAGSSDTTIQLQTMRWIQDGEGDNNDEDPKSLVIAPIFQDVAKVSSVEINSLVDAIINAQASNPKLNINISAGSDNHKKLIQEAFEKKMSQSI